MCGPIYAKGAGGVFPVMNDIADGEVLASAPTANMAFLRSVFDQVEGFDERLYYGSDFDFVWRCADAQHPCYQVGAARMVMDWGPTSLQRSVARGVTVAAGLDCSNFTQSDETGWLGIRRNELRIRCGCCLGPSYFSSAGGAVG